MTQAITRWVLGTIGVLVVLWLVVSLAQKTVEMCRAGDGWFIVWTILGAAMFVVLWRWAFGWSLL